MTDSGVRTRADDPEEPGAETRIEAARSQGRRRTIFYSAFVAGLVALFFGWQNDKDQVQRSRENCRLIQDDRRDRAATVRENAEDLQQGSDFILGNPEADPPVLPADFNKQPFRSFRDVKALVIQQAIEDRASAAENFQREKDILSRIENCQKVFPNPDLNPF